MSIKVVHYLNQFFGQKGGEEAARLGRPVVYECHAGLIDFAAPILLEGRQIGTILGGASANRITRRSEIS